MWLKSDQNLNGVLGESLKSLVKTSLRQSHFLLCEIKP